jgi:hypothetical protein
MLAVLVTWHNPVEVAIFYFLKMFVLFNTELGKVQKPMQQGLVDGREAVIEVEGVGGGATRGVPEGEERGCQGAERTRHFINRLPVTDNSVAPDEIGSVGSLATVVRGVVDEPLLSQGRALVEKNNTKDNGYMHT